MLTQGKNPLYQRLRGGSNPQCSITQDNKHNTLLTELFPPLQNQVCWRIDGSALCVPGIQRLNTLTFTMARSAQPSLSLSLLLFSPSPPPYISLLSTPPPPPLSLLVSPSPSICLFSSFPHLPLSTPCISLLPPSPPHISTPSLS